MTDIESTMTKPLDQWISEIEARLAFHNSGIDDCVLNPDLAKAIAVIKEMRAHLEAVVKEHQESNRMQDFGAATAADKAAQYLEALERAEKIGES